MSEMPQPPDDEDEPITKCPECGRAISYKDAARMAYGRLKTTPCCEKPVTKEIQMSMRGAYRVAGRITHAAGPGRNKVMLKCPRCKRTMSTRTWRSALLHWSTCGDPPHPCPKCGELFGALEVRIHQKDCKGSLP